MNTHTAGLHLSNIDTSEWEDQLIEDVIEGDPAGRVHWLRTEGSGNGVLMAGLFTGQPSKFRTVFEADETFQMLEGEFTCQLDGEEPVRLRPGDIVSFHKGARAHWQIHEPVKKFFVISG